MKYYKAVFVQLPNGNLEQVEDTQIQIRLSKLGYELIEINEVD
jgi:hypothetical protein